MRGGGGVGKAPMIGAVDVLRFLGRTAGQQTGTLETVDRPATAEIIGEGDGALAGYRVESGGAAYRDARGLGTAFIADGDVDRSEARGFRLGWPRRERFIANTCPYAGLSLGDTLALLSHPHDEAGYRSQTRRAEMIGDPLVGPSCINERSDGVPALRWRQVFPWFRWRAHGRASGSSSAATAAR